MTGAVVPSRRVHSLIHLSRDDRAQLALVEMTRSNLRCTQARDRSCYVLMFGADGCLSVQVWGFGVVDGRQG